MANDIRNKLVKWGRAIPRAIVPHQPSGAAGLPDTYREVPQESQGPKQKQMTAAAIIYALGAGVLFVFAIFNLTQGAWFNGIVIFIPAGSLLVLAYKYLQ